MLAIKTAFLLLFVILTAFAGLPYLILLSSKDFLTYNIGNWRWIGIVPFGFGLSLVISMALYLARTGGGTPAPFDPTTKLVIKGPYKISRNPGYIGAVIALLGEAMVAQSFALAIYALLMWLFFHIFVVFYEEPELQKRFGAAYAEYCSKAPRWMPTGVFRHRSK